jgi:hypothetical protein
MTAPTPFRRSSTSPGPGTAWRCLAGLALGLSMALLAGCGSLPASPPAPPPVWLGGCWRF